jgi:hypothetical protein
MLLAQGNQTDQWQNLEKKIRLFFDFALMLLLFALLTKEIYNSEG